MPTETSGRRPLKSRDLSVFKWLATALARAGVTPNAISFSSMIFAVFAGVSLAATQFQDGWSARACWLLAAVGIQLRLIANLIDGMVAVEGRQGGPTGDLWNEAPDRVSDSAIFIGAGFAVGSEPLLGCGAALLSVFVAYVRALGAGVGAGQCFLGPQAKPQRMAVMTVVCLIYAIAPASWLKFEWTTVTPIRLALVIVCLGCVLTACRRLRRIASILREKVKL